MCGRSRSGVGHSTCTTANTSAQCLAPIQAHRHAPHSALAVIIRKHQRLWGFGLSTARVHHVYGDFTLTAGSSSARGLYLCAVTHQQEAGQMQILSHHVSAGACGLTGGQRC